MKCLNCDSEALPNKALCDRCFSRPRVTPDASSFRPKAESMSLRSLLLPSLCVTVLIGLYLFLSGPMSPIPLDDLVMKTTHGDQSRICADKPGCLIVFLAPWCGSCRSDVGFVDGMVAAARDTNLAVEVVVGWSDEKQIRDFAREFKTRVFLDLEGEFRKRLSFSSVPRWFAVNSKKEVYHSFFPYTRVNSAKQQLESMVTSEARELRELL